MTFNFRTHWRTTTALCIASTIALATTAYAANSGGLSNWDKRLHLNRFLKLFAEIENGKNNNNDKNHGNGVKTASPIKHVIVLIGENRGLDHTFGIYKPKGAGQTISNLLSKGIVNEDGSLGPNFAQAQQFSVAAQSSYYIGAPTASKFALQPDQPDAAAEHQRHPAGAERTGAPFKTIAEASVEKDIDPADLDILTTGATGLAAGVLDTRVPGAGSLNGPFQLQGPIFTDDDYTGDMTHRFYQDWQQEDCSVASASKSNTSGCLADLFPFVMAYLLCLQPEPGQRNGLLQRPAGQAPILKQLADRFTLGDNFHQSFHGGTGANHFMLGTGDAAFWSDGNGNPVTPPSNQIANPNPKSGTVNQYTVDNNFSACADISPAGRRADRDLSGESALCGRTELPAQPLLHARQHQPRLPAERCAVGCWQPAAFSGSRPLAMR